MLQSLNSLAYVFIFIALYFEVFLLVTFFEKRSTLKHEESQRPTSTPRVSVIVPCWNEEKTIAGTIDSLLALDYPAPLLEIIVVDDGSTDGTAAILKRYALQNPQVTILTKENGGKHTALNLGIQHASGDIIGCLDADSFVNPEALHEVIKYFEDPKTMAVTPAVRIWKPHTMLQLTQQIEYEMGIFLRKVFAMLGALTVTPGPFSFFRKQVFQDLGGYRHAHNTEDMEYAMRMQHAQYPIVNAHTAHVYTNAPSTLRALYRQRLRWTYGFLANARDYRDLFFNKKFGNVGFLTLPFGVLSIFTAIFMMWLVAVNTVHFLIQKIAIWRIVGFHIGLPHFDIFFFDTSTLLFLEVVAVLFVLFAIYGGKLLTKSALRPRVNLLYFILIYGLLASVWLSGAVYHFARSRAVAWR
ncbi:MAG: glycosyltransferase family 2 protein [Minisyncoccota bacterium]